MFIQTQDTPNPESLKFLPGCPVIKQGTRDFPTAKEAQGWPLAASLFRVEGVCGVFCGSDFITVTKDKALSWDVLKPDILTILLDYFLASPEDLCPEQADIAPKSEIEREICEILETRVRPAIAGDGGDIVFERFEEGVVYVRLHGACAGCPSSTATLKSGIENLLRYYIPEVLEVRPNETS